LLYEGDMVGRREMPNAENCTLSELETAMKAARSARSHVRMLAIRALLLGQPFETVTLFVGRSEKTVSRWSDRVRGVRARSLATGARRIAR